MREAGGDLERATKLLREAGKAGSRAGPGAAPPRAWWTTCTTRPERCRQKLGVLVELDCEDSDFVAETDAEFQRPRP